VTANVTLDGQDHNMMMRTAGNMLYIPNNNKSYKHLTMTI